MSVLIGFQKNMAARLAVEELIELAPTLLIELAPTLLNENMNIERFWGYLAVRAAGQINKVVVEATDDSVMDMKKCQAFERTVVPFKVRGETVQVCNVDPEYWIAITEGKFNRDLRRWMRTKRFRDMQEEIDG